MKAAWLAMILTPAFLAGQGAPASATVEGTVIDSATGAGVGGASVQLSGRPNRYEATSDAVGHFRIAGVVPGTYRASADKDGFTSPPLEGGFSLAALMGGIQVAASIDPVIVDLKLMPLTTIRGRIFTPDGRPGVGVEVFLNPNIFGSVTTDQEGRFAFPDIRAGSYTLIARPPVTAKPEESKDGTKTAMVATYYPSVTDPTLAQQLHLAGPGGEYDIRMQTAPVHLVRGVVLDEAGKPSPGEEITLFSASQGPLEPMALALRTGGLSGFIPGLRREPFGAGSDITITDKDGRFEFPAVPSGDWEIRAGESRSRRGTIAVEVRRADVDDLQLRTAALFNLTAALEWSNEDPGAARFTTVGFQTGLMNLVNADRNTMASAGIMDSRGLPFENLLPGRYKAIAKPGLAVRVFLGQTDVTGQIFPLAAGGPPLRAVVRTWAGSVRGVVEKCGGGTVVLLPQSGEGAAAGQFVQCGEGGSFEMSEVSPGDYYIAAFDRIDGFGPSSAMLNLMPSRGSSVKVEQGSAENVTLSVIPAPH